MLLKLQETGKSKSAQGVSPGGRIWFSWLPGSKLMNRPTVSWDESHHSAVHQLLQAQTETMAGPGRGQGCHSHPGMAQHQTSSRLPRVVCHLHPGSAQRSEMRQQLLSHPVSGTAARGPGHSHTVQKGDSPGFGSSGVSKPAASIREPRSPSSANRAVPLEEQKALGKDA